MNGYSFLGTKDESRRARSGHPLSFILHPLSFLLSLTAGIRSSSHGTDRLVAALIRKNTFDKRHADAL